MSEPRIRHLVSAVGTNRTLEMEDGSIVERHGGSASWRNNNPGNLKFEYAGSADHTVHNPRSRETALHHAKRRYDGVVDLDQWGNAVFESLEAGRAAQLQLLKKGFGHMSVEQMLEHYSTKDYSGATHHAAQAKTIHHAAESRGADLHGKRIDQMTPAELDALGAGIAQFEGYRIGQTKAMHGPAAESVQAEVVHSPTRTTHAKVDTLAHANEAAHSVPAAHSHPAQPRPKAEAHTHDVLPDRAGSRALHTGTHGEDVYTLQHALNVAGARDSSGHRLHEDGHFGRHTRDTVIEYQARHGLPRTGVVGEQTRQSLQGAHAPLIDDPAHPAHGGFLHTLDRVHAAEVERGIPHGPHSRHAAGALVAQMQHDGLERIDRVELNASGQHMRGVQVHPLRDEPGLNRATAPIETSRAATQPLAESTERFATASRQHDLPDTTLAMRGHSVGAMTR